MVKNLFWEKYRPKQLEDMILLPRIKKLVENGIETNLIFYGHYGMGKTALSKIMCSRNPSLEINSSIDTSINV
jgi:replication-associated recombination protein RarA